LAASICRFLFLIVGLLRQHNIIFDVKKEVFVPRLRNTLYGGISDWFQGLLKSKFGDSIKEGADSKCEASLACCGV